MGSWIGNGFLSLYPPGRPERTRVARSRVQIFPEAEITPMAAIQFQRNAFSGAPSPGFLFAKNRKQAPAFWMAKHA
jgi:hypothetical protein